MVSSGNAGLENSIREAFVAAPVPVDLSVANANLVADRVSSRFVTNPPRVLLSVGADADTFEMYQVLKNRLEGLGVSISLDAVGGISDAVWSSPNRTVTSPPGLLPQSLEDIAAAVRQKLADDPLDVRSVTYFADIGNTSSVSPFVEIFGDVLSSASEALSYQLQHDLNPENIADKVWERSVREITNLPPASLDAQSLAQAVFDKLNSEDLQILASLSSGVSSLSAALSDGTIELSPGERSSLASAVRSELVTELSNINSLRAAYTNSRAAYLDKLNVSGTLANTSNADTFKATGFATMGQIEQLFGSAGSTGLTSPELEIILRNTVISVLARFNIVPYIPVHLSPGTYFDK